MPQKEKAEKLNTATSQSRLERMVMCSESLLEFLESDFGMSGRDVRQEAIFCELDAIGGLQDRLQHWASEALPANCNHFEKMKEELEELSDAPDDETEMADLLLALMLYADERGIDLLEAGERKLKLISNRKYGPVDGKGISRHIDT